MVPQQKQRRENKQGRPEKTNNRGGNARMHERGNKDERVQNSRGVTKPKVIYITINDGSDGVEPDKARAGVGVVGTRADWGRVKTKPPNLIRDRHGKEHTPYRTTQPSGCRVQGAGCTQETTTKEYELERLVRMVGEKGHPLQKPGVGRAGGVGLHWQAIAKNIPPTKHTPTTRRQQRTPQHPAHSSLPPRHPTHEI